LKITDNKGNVKSECNNKRDFLQFELEKDKRTGCEGRYTFYQIKWKEKSEAMGWLTIPGMGWNWLQRTGQDEDVADGKSWRQPYISFATLRFGPPDGSFYGNYGLTFNKSYQFDVRKCCGSGEELCGEWAEKFVTIPYEPFAGGRPSEEIVFSAPDDSGDIALKIAMDTLQNQDPSGRPFKRFCDASGHHRFLMNGDQRISQFVVNAEFARALSWIQKCNQETTTRSTRCDYWLTYSQARNRQGEFVYDPTASRTSYRTFKLFLGRIEKELELMDKIEKTYRKVNDKAPTRSADVIQDLMEFQLKTVYKAQPQDCHKSDWMPNCQMPDWATHIVHYLRNPSNREING
jgi:hypothetical protein